MHKKCNKCSEWKPEVEYGKDKRNQDGRQGICNTCKVQANRALRDKRITNDQYVLQKEKTCSQCKVIKAPSLFFRDQGMPDGLATVCKDCKKAKTYAWRAANPHRYNKSQRDYQKAHPEQRYGHEIKRRYGCTLEQYNTMLVAQGGACSICKTLHNPAIKKGRLYVDHCHKTGAVRSLLCGHCNSLLGYAKDDARILLEAVAYMSRYKSAA